MGIDYSWAGTASYPRFNKELCEVAEIFGGAETKEFNKLKFVFPEGTNEILVKWFNNIGGDFSMKETKTVWEYVSKHPEIKEISCQIWEELELCNGFNTPWDIY